MRRYLAALMVASIGFLTLTACGSSAKSTRAVPVDQSRYSVPLLQSASAGVTNGKLTKAGALTLFSMQYGPLPDVAKSSAAPGVKASADLAISGVFMHWGELSDAQRAAIRKYLGVSPTFTPRSKPAAGPGKRTTRKQFGVNGPFPKESAAILGVLEPKLGPLPIEVYVTDNGANKKFAGQTVIDDGPNGFGCYISVFNVGTGPAVLTSTLAHELFHCYQQVWGASPAPWIR